MAATALQTASTHIAWRYQDQRACCPACGDPLFDTVFASTDLLYKDYR